VTVSRIRHTTVPLSPPPRAPRPPAPPRGRRIPPTPKRVHARRKTARIVLLDVLDSLLNKGVVLNADIVLALANVDLVYLRLSALLCAADRIFTR
jgi:Gas vesicle protein